MKAILIDDEPDGIRTLKRMLEWNCPEVDIAATCMDVDTGREKLANISPDVVFMDIRMPGKNGLEMLTELPERNFEVIFVTAHNEYMLQALQFSAVDYLMKPVDEDRLVEAVDRVCKRLKQDEKSSEQTEALIHNINKANKPLEMRLCLPTQRGFTIVKLEEVMYCEAKRSYTVFHFTNNKSLLISKPLFDYDRLLSNIFLRVHKSFLINLLHVKEYVRGEGGVIVMSNGAEIEVSRRKKEQFLMKVKESFKY